MAFVERTRGHEFVLAVIVGQGQARQTMPYSLFVGRVDVLFFANIQGNGHSCVVDHKGFALCLT